MQRIPTRAVRFGLSLVSFVVACSSAASRTRLPSSTGGSVGLAGSGPGAATGRGGQSGQPGSTSTGGLTSSDGATSSTVIASSGGSGGNSGSTTPVSPGAIDTSLDLPPRRQADSGGGYCGETSLQTIALHFGAYVSQQLIRTLVGGPLLLGNSAETVIGRLHFRYASWGFTDVAEPQFQAFMLWMKSHLAVGVPVIFGVWIADHTAADPDYDHLMPAFGIKSDGTTGAAYNPLDILVFDTNLSTVPSGGVGAGTLARTFASLSAVGMSSTTCPTVALDGGCVPWQVDYGTAVLGIADDDHATLPVRLAVSSAVEPDVSAGEAPSNVRITATIEGLESGKDYVLLRYTNYQNVPESGGPSAYLASKTDAQVRFTASGPTYVYQDPKNVPSNAAVFFRCVPAS